MRKPSLDAVSNLSIEKLALRENQEKGTDFAAFPLFVDAVHLSPYGTEKLADAVAGLGLAQ